MNTWVLDTAIAFRMERSEIMKAPWLTRLAELMLKELLRTSDGETGILGKAR